MTREDVKKIFPDATDEQITSFLNQSNSDVAKEKAKAQKVKEQAEKADALEKELEELEKAFVKGEQPETVNGPVHIKDELPVYLL